MNTDVMFSSKTGEHDTPRWLIDEIHTFWRGIDLDPCASVVDVKHTQARYTFTQKENGLRRCWFGKTYVNPPYGRGIGQWVDKAIYEFDHHDGVEVMLLLPARPDTKWWRKLATYPVCFLWGRLKFGDAENSAPFPSALVYIGWRIESFTLWSSQFGNTYIPLFSHSYQ